MSSVMKEFEHLKIHLEELKRATNSFGSKVIGSGGFGKVYEGEVSHFKGRNLVAIKRLTREFGQGDPEFWKEIMMLTRYTHKNLISLLGFCDEDGERILVYEHAFNGSLDRHLDSSFLTWTQRLKICLDAAKGLEYLHDNKGTQQRVLHRDIKSANILLDEKWNAKLSDMGLSKIGPANQQHTVLFTHVVGTPVYCDPQYMETYTLTKESDVYSFGVVLFEVLCGKLCFRWTDNQLETFVPMWKQRYINEELEQIIFKDPRPPMDPTSLRTFSDIAFQCLHNSREQRPTTSLLVKKLELALELQEQHDMKMKYVVGTSQNHNNVDELSVSLHEGEGSFSNKDIMNFAGLTEKKLKYFSGSSSDGGKGRSDVFVNGQRLTVSAVKKAEKLAGPIQPGEYWYDSLAGFWGVMNHRCVSIIPPHIKEFDHPMPKNCAAGNTGVFVNNRELNQKDLDLLARRGLPTTKGRSYVVDISGKVVDEDTGEELEGLGKLAPTVERVKRGFGMQVAVNQFQEQHDMQMKYEVGTSQNHNNFEEWSVYSSEGEGSFSNKDIEHYARLMEKMLKNLSGSSSDGEEGRSDVFVNDQRLTVSEVKRAEKLAGPIQPGEYWYDSLAGFWGVMNQRCVGIIPPHIKEFDYPMPKNCAAGNTGVFVNNRELNQKDLDLLAGRGLPTTKGKSYVVDISGKVVDEDTGEELYALGNLAPTIERKKRGFGMKVVVEKVATK